MFMVASDVESEAVATKLGYRLACSTANEAVALAASMGYIFGGRWRVTAVVDACSVESVKAEEVRNGLVRKRR